MSLKLSFSEKKYYQPIETGNQIPLEFAWSNDGQVAMFDESVIPHLDRLYPVQDREGWFFNETKDRYIAERRGKERVLTNPQFVWRHVNHYKL